MSYIDGRCCRCCRCGRCGKYTCKPDMCCTFDPPPFISIDYESDYESDTI